MANREAVMLDRLFGLFWKTVMLIAGLLAMEVLYLALRGGIYLFSYHTTLTTWLAALAVGFYASTKFRFGKYASKWLGDISLKIFIWLVELIFGLSMFGVGAGLVGGIGYAIIRYPLIVTALACVSAVVIVLMIYQKQRHT
jgi:hypothetical protein